MAASYVQAPFAADVAHGSPPMGIFTPMRAGSSMAE
jgi:hypothetical protein